MIDWFLAYPVHSALVSLLDVAFCGVTGHSDDHWLRKTLRLEELPNRNGGLVAIHDWHIAVHQDEVVLAGAGLFDVLFYLV